MTRITVLYMKTDIHCLSYRAQCFLEWEMFETKVVEKTKTHILCSVSFYFTKNPVVYEIMWKNIVQPGRPQMAIWRMRNACWIIKATNTHSEYVILIVFPLQQWLHGRASIWRYTYIACLAVLKFINPAGSAHIMTDSCILVPQSLQPNAKTLCRVHSPTNALFNLKNTLKFTLKYT